MTKQMFLKSKYGKLKIDDDEEYFKEKERKKK